MDLKNILSFISLGIFSTAIALLVIFILKCALKKLLTDVVKNTGIISFYLKTFIICILFTTFSSILDKSFNLGKDSKFMEYVWKIADGLSSSFQGIVIILMIFLVILTILVSVSKKK